MATTARIEPDVEFLKKALAQGGGSAKKCFQCATCSVVCDLAPADHPFPRQEMIWAQWGLKERLMADPGVWLCHQCNDCTLKCPRGARPSEMLSGLRSLAIEHYAVPGFFARLVSRPSFLPILILIPVIIIGLAGALFHDPEIHRPPAGEPTVEYARMYPHIALNTLFTGLSMLAAAGVLVGAVRYWKAMNREFASRNGGRTVPFCTASAVEAVREIALHKRFGKCTAEGSRFWTHLLAVGSFVGLLIVTLAAITYILLGLPYPMPQGDPFKMLGNLSAGVFFVVLSFMIMRRLTRDPGKLGRGTYFDWVFLGVIYCVVISGIVLESLRLAELPGAAYPTYFVHLVLVFMLLIYLPYTKFAHMVYRATAMVFALGREKGGAQAG